MYESDSVNKMDREEFDVDTGTYMEDVHANDFIGLDRDGDGLIDNVEELVEEADARAKEYNEEKAEQERVIRARKEEEEEKDETEQEQDILSL